MDKWWLQTLQRSYYCSTVMIVQATTRLLIFPFSMKSLCLLCRDSQIGSWTFNILSPLQSKRLISHSAGLWLLTRTNSASCRLVTHSGTAMIGCLAPGGTPLIVCLAYFLPSLWWHILLSLQQNTMQRKQWDVIEVCVFYITCHRSGFGKTKSRTSLLPFPLSFFTAAQIR